VCSSDLGHHVLPHQDVQAAHLPPGRREPLGGRPLATARRRHGDKFNEDFGLEDITNRNTDRYKFRTSPLRNVSLQPTFGHNGAWTRLEDVIRHHLNPPESARKYDPAAAGVAEDLRKNTGPIEPVLKRLDPLVAQPIVLTKAEFDDLVAFVRDGLLDPRAKPEEMCKKIPKKVPSGKPLQKFEECK